MAGDISRINGKRNVAIADRPAVKRMREIAELVVESRFKDVITAQVDAAIGIGQENGPSTPAAKFITDLVLPKTMEVKHSGGIGVLHLIQSLSDPQEEQGESYGTE